MKWRCPGFASRLVWAALLVLPRKQSLSFNCHSVTNTDAWMPFKCCIQGVGAGCEGRLAEEAVGRLCSHPGSRLRALYEEHSSVGGALLSPIQPPSAWQCCMWQVWEALAWAGECSGLAGFG